MPLIEFVTTKAHEATSFGLNARESYDTTNAAKRHFKKQLSHESPPFDYGEVKEDEQGRHESAPLFKISNVLRHAKSFYIKTSGPDAELSFTSPVDKHESDMQTTEHEPEMLCSSALPVDDHEQGSDTLSITDMLSQTDNHEPEVPLSGADREHGLAMVRKSRSRM
ncbi:hypothetical protein BDV95DRAFT_605726 [Massariosphaeria phaeospora]|uniref:Uncharacterized protein n=1 Tax=Massariosphaeria phaeospora TaxID=100035 RepID=A0A7C8MAU5_9PLEO|nr:hypothetical protein BDV95DRAFT_605726 [Massariosphaeria phaeospora]